MPCASRRMPELRLVGHLDLGDQVAHRRIPAREVDAGRLADQAAPAVAADEVLRAQRRAVGELDVDAAVVLREARDLEAAVDRHPELGDPVGHDPLDRGSATAPRPYGWRVGRSLMSSEIRAEAATWMRSALGEEALGDPALVEHLDRARVAARRPASRRAPGRDAARRSPTSTPASASSAASIIPVGPPPAITTACSLNATTLPPSSFRPAIMGHDRGLVSSPHRPVPLEVERGSRPVLRA